MPRPNKSGLDYFPLDVDLDDKIELIEAKHGLLAFGLIIKLFQQIYKNGYYLEASEDRMLLMSKRVNVDINFLNAVIADALRWQLFNEDIFNKHNILTSCGIQKRYAEATKRRKEVDFESEYLLIDPAKFYRDGVNVNINRQNVNINPNSGSRNKQSKEKKSKEKNIYTSDFEKFWQVYPNKGCGKANTFKSWKKLNGKRPEIDTLVRILETNKKSHKWQEDNGRYIPMATTYLNQQRWDAVLDNQPHPKTRISTNDPC